MKDFCVNLLKIFFFWNHVFFIVSFLKLKTCRFFTALKSDEFNDVDFGLAREVFEWFHQMTNMYVACEDSWYSASCKNYGEYWTCPGDLHLNWKNKGFKTIFDLLQVSIFLWFESTDEFKQRFNMFFFIYFKIE